MSRDATPAHASLTHQADHLDLNSRLNFRLCIAPSGSPKHPISVPRNRQQAKVGRPFNNRTPRTRDGVGLNPAALLVRRDKLEGLMVLDKGFAWGRPNLGSLSRSPRP